MEETEDYLDEEREIDISWINEFEKIDKDYESLYMDDVMNITLHFVYINKENEIEKIIEKRFLLREKNKITKEELIGILKSHCFLDKKKHSISTILKYNIDLQPQDIRNFLIEKNNETYLNVVRNIDDILLNRTISMFQDLNDLFILFYEKRIGGNIKQTKRVYLTKNNKTHRSFD